MEGNTELIHLICDILEVKEKKNLVVKNQKYEEGAKLRDIEKTLVSKVGDIMMKSGITENLTGFSTYNIEDIIKLYLKENYGIEYHDHNTPKVLKRQLKLEEIFKKD